MTNRAEVIHPAIYELVALGGRGNPGIKVSAPTRAEISGNLDKVFSQAKERSKTHAAANYS
mgnify:CR=1 FL=1